MYSKSLVALGLALLAGFLAGPPIIFFFLEDDLSICMRVSPRSDFRQFTGTERRKIN